MDESYPQPQEASEAQPVTPIEKLPQELGFLETEELQSVRAQLIEAMTELDWNMIGERMKYYRALAESIVGQKEGKEALDRVKIGLIVSIGLMWREAGKLDSYGAELNNAHRYAHNVRFKEVERALQAAMPEAEEDLKKSEEAEYIGPPTEEIIAVCKKELPPELHEELDVLYSLPPDEVLEEVASLMEGSDIEEKPPAFFARMGWIEIKLAGNT